MAWLAEAHALRERRAHGTRELGQGGRYGPVRLPFAPEYRRSDKAPGHHGGVIATFIDVAGDFAVAIKCDTGGVPTINLAVDYLRMAGDVDLIAKARVRRAGRTIAVADVDVETHEGRLIAVGRATYSTKPQ